MAHSDQVNDIAKYRKGWTGGLPETPCGYGSKLGATQIQREVIPLWMHYYDIQTIADIGAGDLNWVKHIKWIDEPVIHHYDLVPRHRDVEPLDLLADDLPHADCIWLLWVLNHFPEEQMRQGLEKVLSSGCKYLLMTYESRLPDFMDLDCVEEVQLRPPKPGVNTGFLMRLIKC